MAAASANRCTVGFASQMCAVSSVNHCFIFGNGGLDRVLGVRGWDASTDVIQDTVRRAS
mgnify:CR=1 FL=1